MESCEKCRYLEIVGNPLEAINECHRFPPTAMGKELAVYPLVKNGQPGCGDFETYEEAAAINRTVAGQSPAKAKISAARQKALK
jgi:hypothetical protein